MQCCLSGSDLRWNVYEQPDAVQFGKTFAVALMKSLSHGQSTLIDRLSLNKIVTVRPD